MVSRVVEIIKSAEDVLGHRIGPALTHTTGLGGLEAAASATAGHAVGDAMGVLVGDDVVLEGAVALGAGEVPEEHAHVAALAIRGRREVGVVGARGVLDGDGDAVGALAALAEVVGLEVERGLGEAVLVRDIVDRVDCVEGVHAGGVDVGGRRGGGAGADGVVEDKAGAGLARG